MDGFSAAGTAVDLAVRAYKLYKYCCNVRNAPKAIETVKREVRRVEEQLRLLDERLQAKDQHEPEQRQFLRLKGSDLLGDVRTFFAETEKSLSLDLDTGADGTHAKILGKFRRALKLASWPLKEAETKELLEKLSRFNVQLIGLMQSAHVDISVATDKKADDIHEIVARRDLQKKQKDFQKMLDWISTNSSASPKKRGDHEILVPADWLMDGEIFTTWKRGRPWTLTLVADAGLGKSVLSSFILRHLKGEHAHSLDHIVLSIFLRYEDQRTQTIPLLLSVLLRQVLAHLGPDRIPERVESAWNDRQSDNSLPTDAQTIRAILHEELLKFRRVFVIVDGLDESVDTIRVGLLSEMKALQDDRQEADGGHVSFLFTSRPIKDTRDPSVIVCNDCRKHDIRIYYICSMEQAHSEGYALCESCKMKTRDCDGESHRLYEPYTNIDLVLRPPDRVLTGLIEQLLTRERSFGYDNSEERRANVEAGWTKEDTSAQTALGRALRESENNELGERIIKTIVGNASGSFLLAQMQFEHLRSVTRPGQIAKKLATLPKEFNSTYESAMERIDKQNYDHRELGKKIIMWLCHAQRVMSFDELQHAISIDVDAFKFPEKNDSEAETDAKVFSKSDLVYRPLFLEVTVGIVDLSFDDTVRLMHRSAYEYFDDPDVRKRWFPDADSQMASACIAYLSHTELKAPCYGDEDEELIKDRLVALPFAAYASQYWGAHVRLSQYDRKTLTAAEAFVRSPEKLASTAQTSYFYEYYNESGWDVRKGVDALHILSWFGIHKLIDKFVTPEVPVDKVDSSRYGRTPLLWACKGGHASAISTLLKLGADINVSERHVVPEESLTPLTHVAKEGYEKACERLCERNDLNVNATAGNGFTALMFASKFLQPQIIDILCERPDIQLNYRTPKTGATALMLAAYTDSKATVRSLLKHKDRGMDMELTDNDGYGALHQATWQGKRENVHELLEAGADPLARSSGGETPVWFAVNFNHKDILEDFFKRRHFTHEMTVDNEGDGLLAIACRTGEESTAIWLLDQGFNPNVADFNDMTPLHVASAKGYEAIAKILLERGAIRDARTKGGQTPADLARNRQFDDLARYLDPDGDRNEPTSNDLPIIALATRGLEEALRQRLTADGPAALQDTDFDGNTALHLAIKHKHIGCVRAILEHVKDEELINKTNQWRRTPLHTAGWFGSPESTELLLNHDPKPDLDALDIGDRSALTIAIESQDGRTAVMLVEAGADMKALRAEALHVLLEAAIDGDNLAVAEKLVKGGVEVRYGDIRRAKLNGKPSMMRLLRRLQTLDGRTRSSAEEEGVAEAEAEAEGAKAEADGGTHGADEIRLSKESTLNSPGSTSTSGPSARLRRLLTSSDADTIANDEAVCASPEDLKEMESLLLRHTEFKQPPPRTDTLKSLDFPKPPTAEPDAWDLVRLKNAFKLLESPAEANPAETPHPNS